MEKWIGVDLDGTLAHSGGRWLGPGQIGEPIAAMVERVRRMLAVGTTVKIFTARVASSRETAEIDRAAIRKWTEKYLGEALEVTAEKDLAMSFLFDDKCVSVQQNTGKLLTPGCEKLGFY